MLPDTERSRLIAVTAAATIVLVLAGLLVARLVATDAHAMPAVDGAVPAPAEHSWTDLEIPCWSCPNASTWPLRFCTDLDLLAPLGTGERNAAEFFALFAKEFGARAREASDFRDRTTTNEGSELEDYGRTVPFDDPLLLEAEPWMDQARMTFYPDVIPIEGAETYIPNLLMQLVMARTWTVRGVSASDPNEGLEDCRRAIRMGRLLRQEDFILINDLVGLACIHSGARGIYQIAQTIGDHDLALLASVVIGEVAPQRLYTSQRITSVDLSPYVREREDGSLHLDAPDHLATAIFEMLTGNPDNRFRGEAAMGALTLLRYGNESQQAEARTHLERIANGPEPRFAELARWSLDHTDTAWGLEDLRKQIDR